MITLSFLWSWTKLTLAAILAVVIEQAVISGFWGFALAAAITFTAWLVISVGLFREWRAHAAGYRHEVNSIRRETSR
ncbi:hypothetical protein HFP15_10515 [Amycolatopsis sp. K13G38]|uniref:DUF4229 domain-containing protein n=1 Tax=Amycolatopsis acididurans TaxID=2724524 RepID=A0ABX1J0X4_9PSEU|nr:hypothetical protein [Amycolatopsis acididurans]NKQ53314.1 hypothetical protein [Amycolatopsis acididurans]